MDFGVQNDEENYYKKYRTDSCEYDAMYLIKANAPINTEAHANAQSQLASGRVKLLIDERVAKVKLMGTRRGQEMKPEERAEYLKPFTLTSILKEEIDSLSRYKEIYRKINFLNCGKPLIIFIPRRISVRQIV